MSQSSPSIFRILLIRWVDFVRRRAIWVVLVSLLFTWLAFDYTSRNLGINTDTADMISRHLEWRRDYIEYKKLFPQYTDTLLLVIDGTTPDIAADAGARLAQRLERDSELIEWVYVPGGGEYFERSALLYMDVDELEDLSDTLATVQPFLSRLSRDPSLRGFMTLLLDATKASLEGESIELGDVMDRVANAFDSVSTGRFHQLSWWELMLGREADRSDKRRYLSLKPKLDYAELLPVGPVIDHIRELALDLELDSAHGVRVRITGGIALSHEEMQSVSRGMGVAGILALVMVSIVLFVGLRSPRLVLASLLTLVIGLILTAAFAAFAIGHLNLISVAFAVLYIGLGVHYAIHFCLRYQELLDGGSAHDEALRACAADVGSSLVLCAVTTGIGFYAFVPTKFAGVSELGLISGTGMFISLASSLTVLPALLSLSPPRSGTQRPSRLGVSALIAFPIRHRRAVLITTVLISLAAAATLPWVRFDRNPLNLRDPQTESVETYRDLIAESETSPWTMVALAEPSDVAALAKRLKSLQLVDSVVSVADFIPQQQDEKLLLVDELALMLGMDLDQELAGQEIQTSPSLSDQNAALEALRSLLSAVPSGVDFAPEARRLEASMARFESVSSAAPDAGERLISVLESSLVASLARQLRTLQRALEAEGVSADDLPNDINARWIAPDGRHRLEVFPVENLEDPDSLRRFVSAVRSVAPLATDSPVVQLESGNVVVRAFQQAFLSALILIAVLLLVLLRSRLDVILVMTPLLLAGLLTVAATVVLGIPFNFANVITLPLLLGAGVDNGIHMVHRMRLSPPETGNILGTSTTRAVVISALTTICSFGNLAHSAHRGTASMGQLLTIGLIMTLLCTLVVLPVMLASKRGSSV